MRARESHAQEQVEMEVGPKRRESTGSCQSFWGPSKGRRRRKKKGRGGF